MAVRDAGALQRLPRAQARAYDMVAAAPQLRVTPGERFVVETEDAENGRIRTTADLPGPERLPHMDRFELNPCAGPIHVEGARPGDVLAVRIHDIVVDAQGFTAFRPGVGPLADSARHADCRGPLTRIIDHVPGPSGTTADGTAVLDGTPLWSLRPHIGTIGVAPARASVHGADTVFGQGAHGGNMSCNAIRAGNTLLLPVAVDGACLYLGDVHASSSDTELCGVADETRAEVTLSCEIRSGATIPGPRVETPDEIIQLNSSRPLEDAVWQCFRWLIDWLVEEHGFTPRDAYLHMGVNPGVQIRVYQVNNLGRRHFTAGVAFPRRHLPA